MASNSSLNETKLVKALYAFNPTATSCLPMREGEQYEIVDDSDNDWFEVLNDVGAKGYIPKSYVVEAPQLSQVDVKSDTPGLDWFVGNKTREEAEQLLYEDGRDGTFVIRTSSKSSEGFSLSVFSTEKKKCVHYKINSTEKNEYYLVERRKFNSLAELIHYHQHDGAGMTARLKNAPRALATMPQPEEGVWDDSQWEISSSQLILLEELGSGQFGVVKRGKIEGFRDVAIKIMKYGTMSENQFIDEAKLMTNFHHQHLVQLYGICSDVRPIYIITEYMKFGSLLTFLRKYRIKLLVKPFAMLDMCKQVCSGMAYLEKKSYIHRDLAARNCLVGDRKEVKVADFGLSRFVIDDEYTSSEGAKFPIKWVPPEVLNYRRFSSKSDVWSYGVLMWEVFTGGDMPYGRRTNADVITFLQQGQRLQKPPHCPLNVYNIMKTCWQKNPELRPSFACLKEQLDVIRLDANR